MGTGQEFDVMSMINDPIARSAGRVETKEQLRAAMLVFIVNRFHSHLVPTQLRMLTAQYAKTARRLGADVSNIIKDMHEAHEVTLHAPPNGAQTVFCSQHVKGVSTAVLQELKEAGTDEDALGYMLNVKLRERLARLAENLRTE